MNMIQIGSYVVNPDNVAYIDLYHPHYEYSAAARARWIDRYDTIVYFTAITSEGSQQILLTGQQANDFREFLQRERFEQDGLSISLVRTVGEFVPPEPEAEPEPEPEAVAVAAADDDFPF